MSASTDRASEIADRFYMQHGPCCAGCDWWAQANSLVGDCTRSAPVSGGERIGMLGISWTNYPVQAGHVMTLRDHRCGEFKDEFEWTTLPPPYLRRIGYALQPNHELPANSKPGCTGGGG